ncbi:MAG: PsiF family protein [Pseudolabrys sp.]
MMSLVVRTTIAAAVASLMLAGSALAQTSNTAPAMGAAPAKPARSAASIECSKQADAKGLHGKARKKFRSECRKGAAKPQ